MAGSPVSRELGTRPGALCPRRKQSLAEVMANICWAPWARCPPLPRQREARCQAADPLKLCLASCMPCGLWLAAYDRWGLRRGPRITPESHQPPEGHSAL